MSILVRIQNLSLKSSENDVVYKFKTADLNSFPYTFVR